MNGKPAAPMRMMSAPSTSEAQDSRTPRTVGIRFEFGRGRSWDFFLAGYWDENGTWYPEMPPELEMEALMVAQDRIQARMVKLDGQMSAPSARGEPAPAQAPESKCAKCLEQHPTGCPACGGTTGLCACDL